MTNFTSVIADRENNNHKSAVDAFDCEPGFYYQVVRSMLAPGHEIELIFWFKSMGLIPNYQVCNNGKMEAECNKLMEWTPTKTMDFYQWICKHCKKKKNIRENSPFQDARCSFGNALRTLLGWCKLNSVEDMEELLGVKKHSIRTLYNIATTTAKKHLKKYQIGGPNTIVVVDTYPEGCPGGNLHGNRAILCLAEVKGIPPRYWFESLENANRNNPTKLQILKTIEEVVRPGSVLVTRQNSTLCNAHDLQVLHNLFPVIVTVESLERHNHATQNVEHNLETIWTCARAVCAHAQSLPFEQVPFYLLGCMWTRQFGNEAFERILHSLAEYIQ